MKLLHPVVATLADISMNRNGPNDGSNWNQNSGNDAQALINAITFPFIITVVILRHILLLGHKRKQWIFSKQKRKYFC